MICVVCDDGHSESNFEFVLFSWLRATRAPFSVAKMGKKQIKGANPLDNPLNIIVHVVHSAWCGALIH